MDAEKYSRVRHEAHIRSWLSLREMDEKVMDDLPLTGFIVFNGGHAIAAGFLRRCEGSTGMIDSVISNPNASSKDRDEALDLVFSSLIDEAKAIGMKGLIGFSTDYNTLYRSVKHGFSTIKHTVSVMSIRT
jgi:hypothetical protein